MKGRSRYLGLAALATGLLLSHGSLRSADSAWLGDPVPGAPLLISEGPWKVSDARHYRNQVLLAVTPDVDELLFTVRIPAPVVVNVRSKVTTYRASDPLFAVTGEYDRTTAFGSVSGVSSQDSVIIDPGPDLQVGWLTDLTSVFLLTLRIETPPSHDRLLLELEAISSRPATFSELW